MSQFTIFAASGKKMDLNPSPNQLDIHYIHGTITISGTSHTASFYITPDLKTHHLNADNHLEGLNEIISNTNFDIIVWGENKITSEKRSKLTNLCWSHNIGIDIDNVAPTCETLKILKSENRNVLTVIIL